MQKHVDRQVEHLAIAAKQTSTAFTNIETVKCYNAQNAEFTRFSRTIKKAASFYFKQVRGNALQMGYVKFATLTTFMGGFYYASAAVANGTAQTADIITTFFALLEVSNAVSELLPQMIVFEKGMVAGGMLRHLVEHQTLEQHAENTSIQMNTTMLGDVVFRGVMSTSAEMVSKICSKSYRSPFRTQLPLNCLC